MPPRLRGDGYEPGTPTCVCSYLHFPHEHHEHQQGLRIPKIGEAGCVARSACSTAAGLRGRRDDSAVARAWRPPAATAMRSLARGRRCARSGPPAVQHAPARSAPLGFAARRKKRVTGPAAAGPSPPCPLACEGAGISLGPRLASANHQRSHNSHVPPRLRPGGRAPWASARQTPTRSGPRAQRHDIARRAHPHPRGRRPRANSARGRGRQGGMSRPCWSSARQGHSQIGEVNVPGLMSSHG